MQNTVCAIITLINPKLIPKVAKNINVATAVTISGTIKGSVIRPLLNSFPLKPPPLTMTKAEIVAIAVAIGAAVIAIIRELYAACKMSSLKNSFSYQRNEKPVQIIA